MPKFGIVQGRLTPSTELQAFPKDWKKEFWQASVLGYDYIELISEREHNKDNPIWDYRKKSINGFQCPILCNDYIINHDLEHDPSAKMWTNRLIDQASSIGSEMIVLPIMEASENVSRETLIETELYAARNNIKIVLETTENDYPFGIVYDTGNRIFAGANLRRDILWLGDKIKHVHIKDKDIYGNNVLLGTGMVDFREVMQSFKDIRYDGAFTFETVRGKDPIRTAKYNLEFIKFFMAEAS